MAVQKSDREGERLAVLETEMRHTRTAFEAARQEQVKMMEVVFAMQKDVQALKDVLTKAAGAKVMFLAFVAGVGFFFNYLVQFFTNRP